MARRRSCSPASMREAGIRTMDGRGRCMDNIFIERLWRSLKYEAAHIGGIDQAMARGHHGSVQSSWLASARTPNFLNSISIYWITGPHRLRATRWHAAIRSQVGLPLRQCLATTISRRLALGWNCILVRSRSGKRPDRWGDLPFPATVRSSPRRHGESSPGARHRPRAAPSRAGSAARRLARPPRWRKNGVNGSPHAPVTCPASPARSSN